MAPPYNKDRCAAQIEGKPTYAGRPCRACKGTERYVSNYACVACDRSYKRAKRAALNPPTPRALRNGAAIDALRAGEIKYVGAACEKCGGVVRFASNRHCVNCNPNSSNRPFRTLISPKEFILSPRLKA